MRHSTMTRAFGLPFAVATLVLSSCVDGPAAPDDSGSPSAQFIIAPVFALVGPAGSGPLTAPQASALEDAFDLVDNFRMVVTRIPSGQIALDTIIMVTPGQSQYDLSVNVTVNGTSEQFSVVLTAFQGSTELFTADPVTVTATPTPPGAGAPPVTPTDITMRYSGPGSTATTIVLSPAQAVLAPGGTVQLAAAILDQAGVAIAGVPLSWTAAAPAVATVNASGLTSAGGNGATQVTVATPTGLEAQAWIYVLTGELAYVEGGDLKVRAPAGGTATVRASGGASMPAWTADGSKLYYSAGGQVRLAGGGALASGAWPAPSPDGTKLVVDGTTFINDDGSKPTSGPSGSTPLWLNDETLVVAGGSLQSVRADGTGRTTLVAGDATMPAERGGSLAYISAGSLRVQGRADALLTGAGGRPTWSPDGAWLVVSGASGLTLVRSDGSAPPVPLPGLGAASDPAFKPAGSLSTPPVPVVSGFSPAAPLPGDVVTLQGTGFDWIIPANTAVFWPVSGGSVQGTVQKVTATQIEVVMPGSVVAGQVRVTTRSGTGLLAYTPSTSTLEVSAKTPWDAPVAGVGVVVKNTSAAVLGRGTTDAQGLATIVGIEPGSVTVDIAAPAGHVLNGDTQRSLTLVPGPSSLDLTLTPSVASVTLSPDHPTLGVHDELGVTVQPLDINGTAIPTIASIAWSSGSSRLDVRAGGLSTTIVGLQPSATAGDATFSVTLDGTTFGFAATVTSTIRGTIDQELAPVGAPAAVSASAGDPEPTAASSEPAINITVRALQGEATVATATTNTGGQYVLSGLYAGSYTVAAIPKGDYSSVPTSQVVVLDAAHPTGQADFHMSLGVADSIFVAVSNATIESLGAKETVTVQAFDTLGVLLGARPTIYESTDTEIFTVDGAGKVTAVTNGTAWVRVTVDAVKDSILVTVDQKAVVITILDDEGVGPEMDSMRAFVGDTGTALWKAEDANGHPITHKTPTFMSSVTAVSTIDGVGHATIVGPGITDITVAMDGATDVLRIYGLSIYDGVLIVSTTSDLDYVKSNFIGRVTADLVIVGTSLTDLDGLETIIEVQNSLFIQNNSVLTDISGLGSLEWVGAAVEISGNGSLADVSGFSSLEMANGLALESNQVLSVTSGFPALEWLGDDGLYIDEGATVGRFPSLKGIEGSLTVGGESSPVNPIESLDFPSLQCVENQIWIYYNESLIEAKFPALGHVGNCATPFDPEGAPPAPVSSAFGSATASRVAANFRPNPNDRDPRSVEFRKTRLAAEMRSARATRDQERAKAGAERDAVRERERADRANARERGRPERAASQVSKEQRKPPQSRPSVTAGPMKYSEGYGYGDLVVENNTSLTSLNLNALEWLEGNLSFQDNNLGTFTIPLLETIGGNLSVMYSGLVTLTVPQLISVEYDVYIEFNEFFEQLIAPGLQSVGSLSVQSNDALGDFVLESLSKVNSTLGFWGNTWNSELRLPAVENVEDLYIEYNTGLTSVEMATESALALGYYFQIDNNVGLQTINIPGAEYLYYFEVYENPDLLSLDMATTTTLYVDSDFEIWGHDLLQTINVPGLEYTYYDIDIYGNSALTAIDLATTTDLTPRDGIGIHDNYVPHSWTVNIPGLVATMYGGLEIRDNDGLQSVTVATGGPATLNGGLSIAGNAQLKTFNAPSLVAVTTDYLLTNNQALTSMSFGSLTTVGGWLQIEQVGLANLDGLSSLVSALSALSVNNNPSLTSVTGLNGIGTAAGADPIISGILSIQDNAALCQEDAVALHTLLDAKYGGTAVGTVTILNNKPCS